MRLDENSKTFSSVFFWLFFFAVVVFEWSLFRRYAFLQIIPFYPTDFDQASYLSLFYLMYENIQKQGFIAGVWHSPFLATGMLFPLQAVSFFLLAGPSRWHALLINFIYYVALQFCSIKLIKTISKRNRLVLLFFGLLLLIKTPYCRTGSLLDVRIDFMAFCLYGLFICSTVKSNFFLNRQWTVVTFLITALLIFLRTLTFVYFTGIIFSLYFYFLWKKRQSLSASNYCQQIKIRSKNLILFAVLIIIITIPLLWINRETLFNYYVIGHVLGEEKFIRAAQEGIKDITSLLVYYPRILLMKHIGSTAIHYIFWVTISYVICYLFSLRSSLRSRAKDNDQPAWENGFIFFIITILIPLIVLTADNNKSTVVGSIMVMPVIWLIIWLWMYLDSHLRLNKLGYNVIQCLAVVGILFGLNKQLHNFSFKLIANQTDLSTINHMYVDIANYAIEKKWQETNIAFDQIADYLTSNGIAILYYEREGKLISIHTEKLGASIFAINEREAVKSLQRSQVFVLNLKDYHPSFFPFNKSMEKLRPFLKKYAETHFSRLGDYAFLNANYRVYVRAS